MSVTLTQELTEQILAMIAEGLTDAVIAARIGCHREVLRKWRHKYADFAQAVKDAKEHVDEKVEMSLFQRAIGYRTTEKVVFQKKNGEIVYEENEKVWPPDTTAAIFWLKNRQKERWRDVWHIKVDVQPQLPSTAEAIKILEQDFAVLPAVDVKVEDL